jgi:hypothetical protein
MKAWVRAPRVGRDHCFPQTIKYFFTNIFLLWYACVKVTHKGIRMFTLTLFAALVTFGNIVEANPFQKKEEKEVCPPGPQHLRAAVRHIEAGGIGYNKGYSTLDIFLATDPNQWYLMPFLDLRGHVFNDGKFATNAGLGARAKWGCRAYGVNAYYDYRNTHRRIYNQVGAGLETLGSVWDFRINGYLPVGKKISDPFNIEFDSFEGNSILVKRRFQYAMKGLDGEVGFHFGKTANFDFYAAAGPYYFKGKMGPAAVGGKARVAGYYKEYVTLEVSDSWDSVFKNNVQGQVTLSYPFGPKSRPCVIKDCCPDTCDFATTLAMRMVQPVARQEIIVVDSHSKTEAAYNFVIFVDNESSSLGTFDSPYPTLMAAQDNSKSWDIIYVYPGDGTTMGMDDGIMLKGWQRLWGSGVGHSLKTDLGTIFIPAMTKNSPLITSMGVGVTLASNNEVSGFTILDTEDSAISGEGRLGNLSISSCNILACCTASFNSAINLAYTGGAGACVMNHLTVLDTTTGESGAGEGVFVDLTGGANVRLFIGNSTFSGNSFPIDIEAENGSSAVVNATIRNNVIMNNTDEIFLLSYSDSRLPCKFSLNNNLIVGPEDANDETAIYVEVGGIAKASFISKNNSITNTLVNEQDGIFINSFDYSKLNVTVDGCAFTGTFNPLDIEAFDYSNMNVAINRNVMTGNSNALFISSESDSSLPQIYSMNRNLITGTTDDFGFDAEFSRGTIVQFTATRNAFIDNSDEANFSFANTGDSTLMLSSNFFNTRNDTGLTINKSVSGHLLAVLKDNIATDNNGDGIFIGKANDASTICVAMRGNSSSNNSNNDYGLDNIGGTFNLAPCNVSDLNTGVFDITGTVIPVHSCSTLLACPP